MIKYVEYMADLSNQTQATLKSNSRGLASLVVIKSAVLPQMRASASAHKEAKGCCAQLSQVRLRDETIGSHCTET